MTTEFANSRFLAQWLAKGKWALVCDFCDQLFLADPAELFALADDRFAVMVVKHTHVPTEQSKMDDQEQTVYDRKNWSSVILWNREHPANQRLTLEMVNTLPGRDLHRFCWLTDSEIGELPPEWNHLVDINPVKVKPKLLHFTLGTPELDVESSYADVWRNERAIMDAMWGTMRAA